MKKKVVKKKDPNEIDNKYEAGVSVFKAALKNWWRIVLILLAIGLMTTGFSFKCGDNEVIKDPIYQRLDSKK